MGFLAPTYRYNEIGIEIAVRQDTQTSATSSEDTQTVTSSLDTQIVKLPVIESTCFSFMDGLDILDLKHGKYSNNLKLSEKLYEVDNEAAMKKIFTPLLVDVTRVM